MLFAVYVVAHGHDSPGGGFQGGALFAGGLILIKLVRGNTEGWESDRAPRSPSPAAACSSSAASGCWPSSPAARTSTTRPSACWPTR
jgi:hypothetical protein